MKPLFFFFLAKILTPNTFSYFSFKAMGKRKFQKYSYEYLKVGKINSLDMLQFHLIPSGKMMLIHLSKELLHWHLLVLISCWLEGKEAMLEKPAQWRFRALGFGFAHSITQLHQFISLCTRRFRAEPDSSVPSPPCSLTAEGEKGEQRVIKGTPIPCISSSSGGPDFICSYLWAI